jgi:hypothetical protein
MATAKRSLISVFDCGGASVFANGDADCFDFLVSSSQMTEFLEAAGIVALQMNRDNADIESERTVWFGVSRRQFLIVRRLPVDCRGRYKEWQSSH